MDTKVHVLLHEDTNNLKVITASSKISGMLVFKDCISQFSVSVIKHNYQKQLVEESVFGLPILETQESVRLGRRSNKWHTWSQGKKTERFHLNHSQESESKQWAETVNIQDLPAWIDIIFSKLHFPDVPSTVFPNSTTTQNQVFKYQNLWGKFSLKTPQIPNINICVAESVEILRA